MDRQKKNPSFLHRISKRGQAQTERLKIWSLFNSPIVLWLLSAVLLSGISWAHTKWTSELESLRAKATQISRLDQEITHRMSFSTAVAVELQTLPSPNASIPTDPNAANLVLKRIFGTPDQDFHLFPEFKDRTLESLMRELSQFLTGESKACVLMAANRVRELHLMYLRIRPLENYAAVLEADMGQVAELRWGTNAVYGRWSQNHLGVPEECKLGTNKISERRVTSE